MIWMIDDTVINDSSKIILLRELVPKLIEENHRILIFSQWTRILDLLEVLFDEMGTKYLR